MNTTKQFLGDLQQLLHRWERQILKNGSEEQTTAPVTKVDGNQKGAAEPRATVSAEAKSAKTGLDFSR